MMQEPSVRGKDVKHSSDSLIEHAELEVAIAAAQPWCKIYLPNIYFATIGMHKVEYKYKRYN